MSIKVRDFGRSKISNEFIEVCRPVFGIQWDLIKEIDSQHNVQGGKLWIGDWGDYLPDRSDVVKAFDFDSRGGRCLIIYRIDNGFEVRDVSCDSPE